MAVIKQQWFSAEMNEIQVKMEFKDEAAEYVKENIYQMKVCNAECPARLKKH